MLRRIRRGAALFGVGLALAALMAAPASAGRLTTASAGVCLPIIGCIGGGGGYVFTAFGGERNHLVVLPAIGLGAALGQMTIADSNPITLTSVLGSACTLRTAYVASCAPGALVASLADGNDALVSAVFMTVDAGAGNDTVTLASSGLGSCGPGRDVLIGVAPLLDCETRIP
jgi:hypothetical protein